ncbi:MAG: cupin domain-containing protein [Pseudomonadota bacterium]
MPTPPLANLADLDLQAQGHGEGFAAQIARIGPLIGADKLGCTLVVVPPGKKAWPYHRQFANEEMFVILEGIGTLRHEDQRHPIRAGDVIAAPIGEAHQILNTSDAELRYLAISTMLEPEVSEYPDSGKRAAMAGSPPGRRPYPLFAITPMDAEIGYWDGEE